MLVHRQPGDKLYFNADDLTGGADGGGDAGYRGGGGRRVGRVEELGRRRGGGGGSGSDRREFDDSHGDGDNREFADHRGGGDVAGRYGDGMARIVKRPRTADCIEEPPMQQPPDRRRGGRFSDGVLGPGGSPARRRPAPIQGGPGEGPGPLGPHGMGGPSPRSLGPPRGGGAPSPRGYAPNRRAASMAPPDDEQFGVGNLPPAVKEMFDQMLLLGAGPDGLLAGGPAAAGISSLPITQVRCWPPPWGLTVKDATHC